MLLISHKKQVLSILKVVPCCLCCEAPSSYGTERRDWITSCEVEMILFPASPVHLPWTREGACRLLGQMEVSITECLVWRRGGTREHIRKWHGLGKIGETQVREEEERQRWQGNLKAEKHAQFLTLGERDPWIRAGVTMGGYVQEF